jgi:thioredoxin reductase (NADPH)
MDPKGFVLTGAAAGAQSILQTSRPGVLAVGDVRSGSIKRVASAVGEGSMAVRLVHDHLGTVRA